MSQVDSKVELAPVHFKKNLVCLHVIWHPYNYGTHVESRE